MQVLDDEPKNILIALVSQLRPGMDLARVSLPTFVLVRRRRYGQAERRRSLDRCSSELATRWAMRISCSSASADSRPS